MRRPMRLMGVRTIYRHLYTRSLVPGASELSLSIIEECQDHPVQLGVGRLHHLRAHGPEVPA